MNYMKPNITGTASSLKASGNTFTNYDIANNQLEISYKDTRFVYRLANEKWYREVEVSTQSSNVLSTPPSATKFERIDEEEKELLRRLNNIKEELFTILGVERI